MSTQERPPPIPQNWLIPVRLFAVVAAYALYRSLEKSHEVAPSVLVAVGALVLTYSLISRFGMWEKDRSRMLEMGQGILGAGLLVLGMVLLST